MSFIPWPPFKIYEVDTDIGKPVETNTRSKYTEIRKDAHGRKQLVTHRPRKPLPDGKKTTDDDAKKGNSIGKANAKKGNTTAKADAKTSNGAKPQDQKNGDNKNNAGGKPAGGKFNASEWTAEEDTKLIALKAENPMSSWQEITDALGTNRHNNNVKNRHRQLVKDGKVPDNGAKQDGDKTAAGAGDAKKDPTQNTQGGGKKKEVKIKEDAKDKQESGKAPSKAGFKKNTPLWNDGRPKVRGYDLYADERFNAEEIECLITLIGHDEEDRWARLAENFHYVTARQVEPQELYSKFECVDKEIRAKEASHNIYLL